jgi:hypothetical protein
MKGNTTGFTRKTMALFADLPPGLGDPIFADFKFRLARPDAPANARFRVAIDGGGAIRFCFLIESSGDPALDEQGRNFLQLCRFKSPSRTCTNETAPANPTALFWTTTTILWGNDLASNATTPPTSPP